MSSILKALKKLEKEQEGKRADGAPSSGGQYLAPVRRRRSRLLPAAAVVAVLLAAGIWLSADRPVPPRSLEGQQQAAPAQPVAPLPSPLRAVSPASADVVPAQKAVSDAPRTVAELNRKTPVAASRPPVAAALAPPASRSVKPPAEAAPPVRKSPPAPQPPPRAAAVAAAPPAEVEQVRVQRHDIPAPGEQWAAAHLVVSDILPVSGGERMAIVNGLPVMEGTLVEDALVTEIGADRVIFDIGGKSVAVGVSKGR